MLSLDKTKRRYPTLFIDPASDIFCWWLETALKAAAEALVNFGLPPQVVGYEYPYLPVSCDECVIYDMKLFLSSFSCIFAGRA